MRKTKVFVTIFDLAERLPTSATLLNLSRPCLRVWQNRKKKELKTGQRTTAHLVWKKTNFCFKTRTKAEKGNCIFLDVDHVFRGTENGEWNEEKRLEKKKLQEELAKKNKRGVQALDEERLNFFSSLTNKIKNLLQNKLHRPTKIG